MLLLARLGGGLFAKYLYESERLWQQICRFAALVPDSVRRSVCQGRGFIVSLLVHSRLLGTSALSRCGSMLCRVSSHIDWKMGRPSITRERHGIWQVEDPFLPHRPNSHQRSSIRVCMSLQELRPVCMYLELNPLFGTPLPRKRKDYGLRY